jgi:hypothetical protein
MKSQKKIAKYGLRQCVENEVRVTRPQLGHKADYCGSRTAAIHTFCLTCMGGSRADVVACQSSSCPLWQFRPGGKKGVRPPGIPTKEQYKEMIDASVSDAQREAGKKLREGDDGGGSVL